MPPTKHFMVGNSRSPAADTDGTRIRICIQNPKIDNGKSQHQHSPKKSIFFFAWNLIDRIQRTDEHIIYWSEFAGVRVIIGSLFNVHVHIISKIRWDKEGWRWRGQRQKQTVKKKEDVILVSVVVTIFALPGYNFSITADVSISIFYSIINIDDMAFAQTKRPSIFFNHNSQLSPTFQELCSVRYHVVNASLLLVMNTMLT